MKKGRLFVAVALLTGMVITGCQEDVSDLDVEVIESESYSSTGGDNGSGGGDNPPPGSD